MHTNEIIDPVTSRPTILSTTEIELPSNPLYHNFSVEFLGEATTEDGWVVFNYNVLFSSFGCAVILTYMPIDDEPDENGLIDCDVDVHGGGDCVGVPTIQQCIGVAWGVHEASGVAKRFRMTDG